MPAAVSLQRVPDASPVMPASMYTQSIKEFWQTFVDKQVGRQPTHLLSG